MLTMHDEDQPSGEALALPQFGMRRFEWSDGSVEFHLPHGELIALLRRCGFTVEALHELQAPEGATTRYEWVTPEWAHRWPSEEIWVARPRGAGIGRRLTAAVASAALVAALAAPGPAAGADPGRWRLAQADSVPLSYFQGLTHSAAGAWFFDGITVGLFRTDRDLVQKADNPSALTPRPHGPGLQPHRRPDLGRARGRAPAAAARVLRPRSAQRRQHLRARRDRRGRSRHAEAALRRGPRPRRHRQGDVGRGQPRRQRAVDVERATTCWPTTPPRSRAGRAGAAAPVRRLAGAVPPSGVTGAAFYRGRLFLAGQDAGALQLWSVDVTGATRAGARARAAGRGGRVRGPRRPRRARRGAALAALARSRRAARSRPTGRGTASCLTFVPAADARLRVARGARAHWWRAARRASP